ncbi:MAG: peptidoglycan DD-metalloendopeptidase family protein [Chitinophagaceae bacterium]
MKRLLQTIILLLATAGAMAQPPETNDKAELERERREIQNELKEIQGMYNQVKGQTKQSLGQVNMINRKIVLMERLINSNNKELRYIDDDIYRGNLEIYRLEKNLDTLKAQYARTVVYAYKNRSSFDYVNFIFSANSFNDALRRISYLKSYRQYREEQVSTIRETQQLIRNKQEQQLGRKQQKSTAITEQTKQRGELTEQKKEKDAVVNKLKTQEKELQKQIANKKKRDQNIKNAITAIIRREIEAAKKEETARIAAAKKAEEERNKSAAVINPTRPATNTPTATKPAVIATKPLDRSWLELNAKDEALGNDFASNKGKLPWPVDRAIVSIPFGPYSINDQLKGNNPGITLVTPSAGVPVKAVFGGTVSAIHNYGDGLAIIIKHGKYYTTYSNLSGASVTKGMSVKTGQVIGKAGDNEEGNGGQIDFMLMIESKETNPAGWLRR